VIQLKLDVMVSDFAEIFYELGKVYVGFKDKLFHG
jgi:hypothetical protein